MAQEDDPVLANIVIDSWASEDDPDLTDLSGEPHLVGFILANIVGTKYYQGTIKGRELVGLVREPLNPHDPNAIKVVNTRTMQVGHVESSVAAVLAPLIDENLISVEGIVPRTPGGINRYKIPFQVHVFARFEAFERVKSVISGSRLFLFSQDEPCFALSDAVVVKEKNRGAVDGQRLDDIFKIVDEKVSKMGVMEPFEPPKEIIKSELFLHQKEGLGWLVKREDSCELPPFWVEESGGVYVNELTNYQTNERPEPIRGGIFADDMGLGKTLTLLSLIALDKCGSVIRSSSDSSRVNNVGESEVLDEEDEEFVFTGKKSKRGRMTKMVKNNNSRKKQKIGGTILDKTNNRESIGDSSSSYDIRDLKATLVVCPPSVFSTWITQLEEHTRLGKLKVYMYYGERTKDVAELQKYDLVLTTYSTLGAEESWSESPMFKIKWWRVILDEAHLIKNTKAQQSRAVTQLKASRRWVVTGTPIQNGSLDLFSFMVFLRFQPFSVKSYWTTLVQRPLERGSEQGLSRLQAVMATISLRRTKDKGLIGLPPKIMETCFVNLSDEERELYDRMEGDARGFVRDFIYARSVTSNYTTVLSIILRLRQICTNLALCPSDLITALPTSKIEDVSNNPELLKKMVAMLQDGEDFDCPVCISPPTDTVITRCAHIFCRPCILKTLKRAKPCCPLCRRQLSESDLFSAPPEDNDNSVSSSTSSAAASSKVSALLTLLSVSRDENPSRKSVVFSQFRKLLILLEGPLKEAGFKILRLDGSMSAKKRAQIIQDFHVPAPEGPTILLASLKASGTGINLSAACRVYLMEPWWNPAVEEQAMDRVHRIGQTEDVKVVRIIAQNSIEERILELQEKKRKLAREAFGRRGGDPKDRREISIDDLRTLMSL